MQMEGARADMIGADLVSIETRVWGCACVKVCLCGSCYRCGGDCGVMLVAISVIVIVGNALLLSRAGQSDLQTRMILWR